MKVPGILRNAAFRASFACLVSCEILTGRSSGGKAPLTVFPGDAEPDDDWFEGAELVRDWSEGAWLCDVKLDELWCDVLGLFMDLLAAIKVVGE